MDLQTGATMVGALIVLILVIAGAVLLVGKQMTKDKGTGYEVDKVTPTAHKQKKPKKSMFGKKAPEQVEEDAFLPDIATPLPGEVPVNVFGAAPEVNPAAAPRSMPAPPTAPAATPRPPAAPPVAPTAPRPAAPATPRPPAAPVQQPAAPRPPAAPPVAPTAPRPAAPAAPRPPVQQPPATPRPPAPAAPRQPVQQPPAAPPAAAPRPPQPPQPPLAPGAPFGGQAAGDDDW